MTEVKMDKGTKCSRRLVYTRDSDGQVKKTTAKNLPGTEATENTYDENNRLTKYGSTEYKYDAAQQPDDRGLEHEHLQRRRRARKRHRREYTYDELGERTKTRPKKDPRPPTATTKPAT